MVDDLRADARSLATGGGRRRRQGVPNPVPCDYRSPDVAKWQGSVSVSEKNKALVRSFIELYNASDWVRLDPMIAPGYVHRNNDAALTWDQFKRGAAWLRRGMPDFRLIIRDIVAEGDRVALRLEGRGTHQGSLFGEAPTGAAVIMHVQWICLFEDEMLAEDWEAADEYELRRQVGALPPGS
jgi:predicted ester cyclase